MWFRRDRPIVEKDEEERPYTFTSIGLEELLAYVLHECGIDHLSNKEVLRTRIAMFCERERIESFSRLLEMAKIDRDLWQRLVDLLTVNETYFLREKRQLDDAVAFGHQRGGTLDILCAPCSSGEEMYSLAILFAEANMASDDVSIIGIDINSQAIETARQGVYSTRAVHRLDDRQLKAYFSKREAAYHIDRTALCPMTFHTMNIFDRAFDDLGTFDAIFCRNMLIYFDEHHREKAITQLYRRLRPDGRLYLGHADLFPAHGRLRKVYEDHVNYYIRDH